MNEFMPKPRKLRRIDQGPSTPNAFLRIRPSGWQARSAARRAGGGDQYNFAERILAGWSGQIDRDKMSGSPVCGSVKARQNQGNIAQIERLVSGALPLNNAKSGRSRAQIA
jgi:hypothetical protein